MTIHTGRWDEPLRAGAGTRILICRYRPRAVRKEEETWDEWLPALGPSKELHAQVYGKGGRVGMPWDAYRTRYLAEMRTPEARERIEELARRVAGGEAITLLCSSACVREERCHRGLLKGLILKAAGALTGNPNDETRSPNQ